MRAVTKLKQSKTAKNINNSGLVSSTQQGVHPRLEACVRRHLATSWAQPLHRPTLEAWRQLELQDVFASGPAVVLDSGCGTGESTRRLALMYPRHLVIGVDRSLKRLGKSGVTSGILHNDNLLLVRAELATFWRLLLNSGRHPERHFLFYPNPWPKPGHLSRRWHGHPVFPEFLTLGGDDRNAMQLGGVCPGVCAGCRYCDRTRHQGHEDSAGQGDIAV